MSLDLVKEQGSYYSHHTCKPWVSTACELGVRSASRVCPVPALLGLYSPRLQLVSARPARDVSKGLAVCLSARLGLFWVVYLSCRHF